MYQIAKRIYKTIQKIAFVPFVLHDYVHFRSMVTDSRFQLSMKDLYPQILDQTKKTGFDRHYVYHTAWAARVVQEINPDVHVDIASSLYFPAIMSAFVPVQFYDYRPAVLDLNNLESNAADLVNLHFETGSITSLSCMHTVEHIGLGRYGDTIDPDGDKKACKELARVLALGGSLLFVVPIGGEPRIQFNAHRIYTYDQVLELFPNLELREFAFIPEYEEHGGLIRNADPTLVEQEKYACGCFWFKK